MATAGPRSFDVAVVGKGSLQRVSLPPPLRFGALKERIAATFCLTPSEVTSLELRCVGEEPTRSTSDALFAASSRNIESSADITADVEYIVGKISGGAGGAGTDASGEGGAGDATSRVEDLFIVNLAEHTETASFRPTQAQLDALLTRDSFAPLRRKLLGNKATRFDMVSAMHRLRTVVSTTTASRFQGINQLLLDGDIPGATGQQDVALQYAFRGSQLLCAKVGPRAKLQHEADVWRAVSTASTTPALLPILEALPMPRGGAPGSVPLLVLVMPLCGMTVGAATVAFEPEKANDRAALLANTATCMGAAVAAFANAGWVHGDIKPSNLMLLPGGASLPGVVVLADYGSAVVEGAIAHESTLGYGLGATPATWSYDVACLASTLSQLLDTGFSPTTHTLETLVAFASTAGSGAAPVLAPFWQLVARSAQLAMAPAERSSWAAMMELRSFLVEASSAVGQVLVAGGHETLASTVLTVDSVWPQAPTA